MSYRTKQPIGESAYVDLELTPVEGGATLDIDLCVLNPDRTVYNSDHVHINLTRAQMVELAQALTDQANASTERQ